MAADEAGRGHLRASHADREHVIAVLKAAFVEGRLTRDELDTRAGQTFAARTYADLAALTTDLPARLTEARPPRQSGRAGPRATVKQAKVATYVGIALTLLAAAAFLGPGNGAERLIAIAIFFIPLGGLSLGGLLMFHSWLEKHSQRGQLPPRPTQGSQALESDQNGEPGDDWTLCQGRTRARTRHRAGHGATRRSWRPGCAGLVTERP